MAVMRLASRRTLTQSGEEQREPLSYVTCPSMPATSYRNKKVSRSLKHLYRYLRQYYSFFVLRLRSISLSVCLVNKSAHYLVA